jgi:hypothetical protein
MRAAESYSQVSSAHTSARSHRIDNSAIGDALKRRARGHFELARLKRLVHAAGMHNVLRC